MAEFRNRKSVYEVVCLRKLRLHERGNGSTNSEFTIQQQLSLCYIMLCTSGYIGVVLQTPASVQRNCVSDYTCRYRSSYSISANNNVRSEVQRYKCMKPHQCTSIQISYLDSVPLPSVLLYHSLQSDIDPESTISVTMPPSLEHVLTVRTIFAKDDLLRLGSTKGGADRLVAPVQAGSLKGSGIDAELVQGGSDWPHMNTNTGTIYLDTRAHFRSKDGDSFYLQYRGIMKFDDQVQLVLQWSPDAKTTKGGDHYWMTTPTIEASNEKDKWVEQCWFVGQGHFYVPDDGVFGTEYEIYKLVAG